MEPLPEPFACRECGQMTAPCVGNDIPGAVDPDECPISAADASAIHCACGRHLCAACFRGLYGGGTRQEAMRLFAPAPNVIPGQLEL